MPWKEQIYKILFILLIIFVSLFSILSQVKGFYTKELKVWFLDVGQGDAIFIKTPQNYKILIDGGPSKKVLFELSEILPPWDKKIDIMILTHPHADHLIGLIEVLKVYQVEEVWFTGVIHTTPEYREFLETIKERTIPVKIIKMGDKKIFSDGSKLEILWPKESLFQKKVDDLNHFSIVSRLSYSRRTFLFSADIDKEAQEEILKNFSFRVDVLKIPHHGAKNWLSEEFLKTFLPSFGVICVGQNKFGHPAKDTLELLNKYQAKVLRVDTDGLIEFSSDGENMFYKKRSIK